MTRSPRRVVAALAVGAVVAATFAHLTGSGGRALGPVIAISPEEVTPAMPDGIQPTVSERGNSITAIGDDSVGWALLDTEGPDPERVGQTVAGSGDGCAIVWVDFGGDLDNMRIEDRCNPGRSRTVLQLPNGWRVDRMAVSRTGEFVAVQVSINVGDGQIRPVFRLNTRDSTSAALPTTTLPGDNADAAFGLDISDDGNFVVVAMRVRPPIIRFGGGPLPERGSSSQNLFVAGWPVGGEPSVVSSADGSLNGWAAYPSVSGDGRFVTFAASSPRAGNERSAGPWIYVRDRQRSDFQLVSPPERAAIYSSVSTDATQVAYAPVKGPCSLIDLIERLCRPSHIEVAYGSAVGLTGPLSTEIVSLDASGRGGGEHRDPFLSGNGRYIAWSATNVDALVGRPVPNGGNVHVVARERDASIQVGDIPFGPVVAPGSRTGTSTVTNSGRTTVTIASIVPSPGEYTVVGGSCAVGTSLPPGANCTVDVRFTAAGAARVVTGTLTVSESGFAAVRGIGTLFGAVDTTTTSTTTTTTTTTVPGGPTTTTTLPDIVIVPPVTVGTVPGSPVLSAAPDPVDFGDASVLIASDIRTVTVTNSGTGGGDVVSTITGTHAGDFALVGGTCRVGTLLAGQTCTLDYRMTATASGERTADLTLTAGSATTSVTLIGVGRFEPRLAATPATVTERGITTLLGQGFPPGEEVTIRIDESLVLTGIPDDAGIFRVPFSPIGRVGLGPHTVAVDDAPGLYEGPEASFVVVLPTFTPQGPTGPAFSNNLLVARG